MADVAPMTKLKKRMTAYEILSVNPKSPNRVEEIKRNYRLLAKKHHPDRGGIKEVFQAITEAHNRIGDFAARYAYDRCFSEGQLIDMAPVIAKTQGKARKVAPLPGLPSGLFLMAPARDVASAGLTR